VNRYFYCGKGVIIIETVLFYPGLSPKSPTIVFAPEVLVRTFSTVNLTCSSDVQDRCPTQLIWHNETAPLENGVKYKMEQTKMSKCKLQSILFIFNVTKDDEGNYSCNWKCNNRVAGIHFKVLVQSQTGKIL